MKRMRPCDIDVTKANLEQSIRDEKSAADVYKIRAKKSDPKTAHLYQHIAKEEDKHKKEFEKRLNTGLSNRTIRRLGL
jgi:rubrerythrin